MLRVVWREGFQTGLSPILGCSTKWSCFSSFLPASAWPLFCTHLCQRFPSVHLLYWSIFQEQVVDGKGSYFQENQRMGWTITVQTWLCEAALFGELLVAAPRLTPEPWSQSAAWWELPRAWPFHPVGCRAALPWVGCGAHGSEAVLASGRMWALGALYCERGLCDGCGEKWPCWLQSCWVGSTHLGLKQALCSGWGADTTGLGGWLSSMCPSLLWLCGSCK